MKILVTNVYSIFPIQILVYVTVNMLSNLIRRVSLLALRNQFNDVCVAAPRLVYNFDKVYAPSANQNYFARSVVSLGEILAPSSIVHDDKKDVKYPKSRKKRAKYATGFSAEDDKVIIKYVKKYGKGVETWQKLANIFGRKNYANIRKYYEFYLENKPTVTGRFSKKEDEFILSFVEKNGKEWSSIEDLTKQLGRSSPNSVLVRYKYLVSNNVRNRKNWELFEEEEMMKAVYNMKEINPSDWTSLESVSHYDFIVVSEKLQRTPLSCLKHWQDNLLPILKTHHKGLPLSAEWKKDFMLYVIKNKIRHPKELDLSLAVEDVCPGQTSFSLYNHAAFTLSNYRKRNVSKNLKDLILYEIMTMQMENKNAPNSHFNVKKMEKNLRRKIDIVDIYKSMMLPSSY